jgi:hypothetical protein
MNNLSNWFQDYRNDRADARYKKVMENPDKYGVEGNTEGLGMGVDTSSLYQVLTDPKSTEYDKMKALDDAKAAGVIDNEFHTSSMNSVSNGQDIEGLDKLKSTGAENKTFDINNMPYLSPTGSDLNSRVYNLGRALGAPKGAKGKTLDIIGNSLSLGLGLAREGMSGYANQKMDRYAQDWYNKKKQERRYVDISQTANANMTGSELGALKYGGLFTFEDGGGMFSQMMGEDQNQMGSEDRQEMPEQQGQEPQNTEGPRMEQIAQQLVAKLGSVEAIDAYLKQQGVDEQTYQEVMQIAQQLLGGDKEEENLPKMKGGGSFKHKVGDSIDFKYGGKSYKGKISKIENGQIFL